MNDFNIVYFLTYLLTYLHVVFSPTGVPDMHDFAFICINLQLQLQVVDCKDGRQHGLANIFYF